MFYVRTFNKKMRVVSTVFHPEIRISILHWNGKFLLKFERPFSEQVFKLPEQVASESEVKALINSAWVEKIVTRFVEMETEISSRLEEIQKGE